MRWRELILVLVLFSLSGLPHLNSCNAETEQPNSLYNPQILVEGNTDGELNLNETDETKWEKDHFEIDLKTGHMVYYSVKKTDTESGEISIVRLREDRQMIGDMYWGENTLSVPGELFEDHFVNNGAPSVRFLKLSGKGSYTIHLKEFDLDDPMEPENDWEKKELINGDTITGKVYSLDYRGVSHVDSDAFVIKLDSNQDVTVRIRKLDDDGKEIHTRLYEDIYSTYTSEEAVLREKGDLKVLEYHGSYSYEDEIYLDVDGEGEYEIEVIVEDPPEIGLWILGTMFGVMCFALLISLSPYIIGIVILIFFVRYDSKKKKRKKEERLKDQQMEAKRPKQSPFKDGSP